MCICARVHARQWLENTQALPTIPGKCEVNLAAKGQRGSCFPLMTIDCSGRLYPEAWAGWRGGRERGGGEAASKHTRSLRDQGTRNVIVPLVEGLCYWQERKDTENCILPTILPASSEKAVSVVKWLTVQVMLARLPGNSLINGHQCACLCYRLTFSWLSNEGLEESPFLNSMWSVLLVKLSGALSSHFSHLKFHLFDILHFLHSCICCTIKWLWMNYY